MWDESSLRNQLRLDMPADPFYIQSDISNIVKEELGEENQDLAFRLSDKIKEWIENVYYQIMNEANNNICAAVRDCENHFYNELQIFHSEIIRDIDNKFSLKEQELQKSIEKAVLIAKGQEDPDPEVSTQILKMMFDGGEDEQR